MNEENEVGIRLLGVEYTLKLTPKTFTLSKDEQWYDVITDETKVIVDDEVMTIAQAKRKRFT